MRVEEIRNICNLGTGTMGFGTALMFAMAGFKVRMFGRSDDSGARGYKNIKDALAIYCRHGLVTEAEVPHILERVQGVTTLEEAAREADFVIESIAEDLGVKRDVFGQLDKLCAPHTIFATNTSGLSPTAIAENMGRKQKFVVAHFWNPPHLVPLVEVVPGKYTDQQTVETTAALMEKIGKKPVVLNREALGFIGNRLQLALLREAWHIIEAGIATPEAVDTTVKYSLGRRLGVTGPLESADLGGLDIFNSIASYLFPDLSDTHQVPSILKERVAARNLGAKTGTGFYDWTPEKLGALKQAREDNLIEWLRHDKAQQG